MTITQGKKKIITCLFFIILFGIGLSIFSDYGISWDEKFQRDYGHTVYNYIFKGDEKLFSHRDRYYGPVFEVLLVFIEKVFNLSDSRDIHLMRHLATFLIFFTGVCFFYQLCKYRFQNWEIGILGSLFLILSPRIFAHSFYNSKDIPFLSLFIVSIYTLVRYLDKKTFSRAILHALASAFLIDIRVLGIIVPFITILFTIVDLLRSKNKRIIITLLVYIFWLIPLVVLFWPILWQMPLHNFIEAFKHMSRFPWNMTVLYLGDHVKSTELPWHYVPLWITISIPLSYVFCFFIGLLSSLRNPVELLSIRRNDLIFMLWFFLPLVSLITLRSVLYDAWRQTFFIYPGFLMLALIGLRSLFKFSKKGLTQKVVIATLTLIMAVNLIGTVIFMVRYHPYQNVYFNVLAGGMKNAKDKFELDYWGLSYRRALEYILENDTDDIIKVCVANPVGRRNACILPRDSRSRFVFVNNPSKAKYFLSNYRWYKKEYSYVEEYYSIKIDGAKIMVVYKL